MRWIYNFLFVLRNKLFGRNYDHFLNFKYEKIKKYYGTKCLDIGAGYGHFSNYLNHNGHDITAVDVTNEFKYDLNFKTFDGTKIDYKANSFNTSIIMFVLHHTDNQIELLREASRVTKDYIIIAEDIMVNKLDKVLGNIHLNTSPWEKSNNLFHSTNSWEQIFKDLDLDLVETVKIPRNVYPIYPVNRSIFVLKKNI